MRAVSLLAAASVVATACIRPRPGGTTVGGDYGFEPNYALAFTGDNSAPSQFSTTTPPWNARIELGQWSYASPSCAAYAPDGGGFYSGPLEGYDLTISLTTNGDFASPDPGPSISPGAYTVAANEGLVRQLAALNLAAANPSGPSMLGVGVAISGTVTITTVGTNLEGSFNARMQLYDGGTAGLFGSFDVPYCRDPVSD